MNFVLTLKYDDGAIVSLQTVTWTVRSGGKERTGSADTLDTGVLAFDSDDLAASVGNVTLETVTAEEMEFTVRRVATVTKEVALKRKAGPVVAIVPVASHYIIADNNTTHWDWIIWETEGNPDPKYQRGGRARKLGLYSLNYDLLRKAGGAIWSPPHKDNTLGGGFVKVAVLDELDYSAHQALINAFLPCFAVRGGKLAEPSALAHQYKAAVGRNQVGSLALNVIDVRPPSIVMPFNYDDNSSKSKAIGKKLTDDLLADADASRLADEMTRWSTASRSTITAFDPAKPSLLAAAEQTWTLRPTTENVHDLPQVIGDTLASKFADFQNSNGGKRYYSVKTGVDFVATQNQGVNDKDLLEGNSIHAMSRSNLIAGMLKKVGQARFEAQYQIEILSILLGKGGAWDGIQVRDIGEAGRGEIWFPALAIPMHGKAFAEAWRPGCNWVEFWTDNFARPLGRAKAEMLAYFGLQHMTSNAQNFLIAFDRATRGSKAKHVILRDIGDTILHKKFFDVLQDISPALFKTTWDHEVADKVNGIVLEPGPATIGGAYANPQITRIGVGIVFFFLPFLKGNLDTEADPAQAAIVAKWCVEHNNGFLDYMREKLGYSEAWSAGPDVIPPELAKSIRENADLSLSGKSDAYVALAADVMTLSATTRQRLRGELEADILAFLPTNKADVKTLQQWTAGHELLICAEIHGFIQSPAGKLALVNLHKHGTAAGNAVPVGAVAAVVRGPSAEVCGHCAGVRPPREFGWYKCKTCTALCCPNCVPRLAFPPGVKKIAERATKERVCGVNACAGVAEPV